MSVTFITWSVAGFCPSQFELLADLKLLMDRMPWPAHDCTPAKPGQEHNRTPSYLSAVTLFADLPNTTHSTWLRSLAMSYGEGPRAVNCCLMEQQIAVHQLYNDHIHAVAIMHAQCISTAAWNALLNIFIFRAE